MVATTVMLSFIPFWRAAAMVLCDLGSAAYYAGGIAEGFFGKSVRGFILGIMLFSRAFACSSRSGHVGAALQQNPAG